ncbi:MAG: sugar ABC transporter permease [Oscillospiraceae bacterium]|nr:MAG: sugar ABC transporter permease [Oscillospiraceae bacterium]
MFIADDLFMTALKNTMLFAVVLGPGGYILSLFFAWLINELTPKVRAFMTLIYYAPTLANVYVVWKLIFSSDTYGYLNGNLIKLGLITSNIRWLEDVNYIVPCVMIVLLWSSLGVSFLTFIAGLQNVDKTLYEAAALDGVKNRWQELWYVTCPICGRRWYSVPL